MIPWLGYFGLVLRSVLTVLLSTVVYHIKCPMRVKPRLRKQAHCKLIRTGFSLFSFAYLRDNVRTAPRIILLLVGGVELVGLYSPAETLFRLMKTGITPLRRYLHPKLTHKFGSIDGARDFRRLNRSLLLALFLFLTPVTILGWFLIPLLFRHVFPQYLASISVAQFNLVAGAISAGLINVVFLESMRRLRLVAVYTAACVLLGVGIPVLFVTLMDPLIGIGWSQIAISLLLLILLVDLIRRGTRSEYPQLPTALGKDQDHV
ncbi:oligosaccharide flippase family protein [bacterium]|nr:oligosaccharide flippase family protein [bacterium]